MKTVLNKAIGDRWLSAWQIGHGVVWVQTRDPKHARRMAQRKDNRIVATGVTGGYLRIFEFQHGLAWAQRLITRYQIKNETPTNVAIIAPASPSQRRMIQIG